MSTTFLVAKNRAYSKLAAAITSGATTITVTAGEGANFPSTYPFHLTIEDEIMSCTARSTDSLTVVRAQQGTSAVAHPNKAYVALNITAKSVTDLNTAVNFIEKYADYALAFYGVITSIDDTTHFRVAGLAGMGTGWFKTASGTPYEIYVLQADGAAPEGEQTPVVAYTSVGGIFQHAILGGAFEVDDEVMIVMPLLASLGTKATAAASGAVTSTDYLMAYIKQLVTLLLNATYGLSALKTEIDANETKLDTVAGYLDTEIQVIIDDLDNVTDGLGALKTLIEANATLIGAKNATATADDLSDIATTDVSAKVRRLLLRFSSGAFSVSIDGSARTNLDALYTALGVLLGTRDATVSAGVLADTESVTALLRRIAQGSGLSMLGDITGYTDVNNLVVEDFIGWEDGYFIGWTAYLERDNAGAGAIPQGSRPVVTGYTSSTGALVLSDGLAAAGAVGDHLRLIHPILLDAWNLRGGPDGVADVIENQAAELDTARGTSGAVSVDGGEDDLYNESSDNEFILQELRVDLNNLTEGDVITFKVYTTEGGTERKISEDNANTFTDTQDPARVEIIGSANQVWGREGIRVTAVKVSGTTRNVTAYYRDSKRGS